MSLSSDLQKLSQKLNPPFNELVELMATSIDDDSNHVVYGQPPGDQMVSMLDFCIVGLVPGNPNFVSFNLAFGGEYDEARSFTKMHMVAKNLSSSPPCEALGLTMLARMLHSKFGLNSTHVVGVLGLCRADDKKELAVLWTNPNLTRDIVEHIVKTILIRNLGNE
jgi:hypothetical protein